VSPPDRCPHLERRCLLLPACFAVDSTTHQVVHDCRASVLQLRAWALRALLFSCSGIWKLGGTPDGTGRLPEALRALRLDGIEETVQVQAATAAGFAAHAAAHMLSCLVAAQAPAQPASGGGGGGSEAATSKAGRKAGGSGRKAGGGGGGRGKPAGRAAPGGSTPGEGETHPSSGSGTDGSSGTGGVAGIADETLDLATAEGRHIWKHLLSGLALYMDDVARYFKTALAANMMLETAAVAPRGATKAAGGFVSWALSRHGAGIMPACAAMAAATDPTAAAGNKLLNGVGSAVTICLSGGLFEHCVARDAQAVGGRRGAAEFSQAAAAVKVMLACGAAGAAAAVEASLQRCLAAALPLLVHGGSTSVVPSFRALCQALAALLAASSDAPAGFASEWEQRRSDTLQLAPPGLALRLQAGGLALVDAAMAGGGGGGTGGTDSAAAAAAAAAAQAAADELLVGLMLVFLTSPSLRRP